MDNLFCGNLVPPPLSGSHTAAGLSSAPAPIKDRSSNHSEVPISVPKRRPFLIGIASERRSASRRNPDRHHFGIVIGMPRNTQIHPPQPHYHS
jgi:hypothetical protein